MIEAIEKIRGGVSDAKKVNRVAGAIAEPVADKIVEFCQQNEEFARAVMRGGNFPECMTAVSKGVGSAISDLDAYTKAVRFFFPGAKIRVAMTIDLVGDAAEPESQKKAVIVNLMDFI